MLENVSAVVESEKRYVLQKGLVGTRCIGGIKGQKARPRKWKATSAERRKVEGRQKKRKSGSRKNSGSGWPGTGHEVRVPEKKVRWKEKLQRPGKRKASICPPRITGVTG